MMGLLFLGCGLVKQIEPELLSPSLAHNTIDFEMDEEENEDEAAPMKRQKVMEKCRFWPVCKSGDECLYHHPTTQCK